ncbi:RDD family protein [Thiomicrorhabdus sp. 6S3-12]|uniref:RDD family protein n=1 Tax=Thiomicrorhabdus sp. 6S3-12 TaxID=2819681 RepID=UPI001AAD8F9D|nr:RDD family protein [Thiomicrorhabdus sp. 6S3-12]MBO1924431.1 RDD family protein [Thiomicrorhabdus sp. 6S3-12]
MPFKIIFAMLYDFILLCAIWFAASIPFVLWQGSGEFATDDKINLAFQLYLIAITYLYLTYFWTQSGQTPGLRTWKLQLQREDGYLLTRHNANLRFLLAVPLTLFFGLTLIGFITPKKQLLHDQLAKTKIVPISD